MIINQKNIFLLLFLWVGIECEAYSYTKVQADSIAVLLKRAQKNTYKNPEHAEVEARQAYELAQEMERPVEQGEALRIIGGTFYIRGDYDLALDHFLQAYLIFEESLDTIKMTRVLSNLGLVYKNLEDYPKSLDYYARGLQLCSDKDTVTLSKIYNNIGVVHRRQKNYDSAFFYFSKSLKLKELIGNKKGMANTLTNLGNVTALKGDNQEAILFFRKSLRLEQQLEHQEGVAKNMNNMAHAYWRLSNVDSAMYFARIGLKIAQQLNTKAQIKAAAEILASCFFARNNYKLAYDYQQLLIQYKDSLNNDEVSRKIGQLESKLEMAKQQSEIERLTLANELQASNLRASKNRVIWISVFCVVILASAIIIYLLRLRAYKIESLAQASQLDALQKRYLELVNGPASFDLTVELPELNKRLFNPLTEREYEILHLSLQGRTNKQIADKIFVSVSTVKFHLRNTYSKLGVSNRKEALEYVFKIS